MNWQSKSDPRGVGFCSESPVTLLYATKERPIGERGLPKSLPKEDRPPYPTARTRPGPDPPPCVGGRIQSREGSGPVPGWAVIRPLSCPGLVFGWPRLLSNLANLITSSQSRGFGRSTLLFLVRGKPGHTPSFYIGGQNYQQSFAGVEGYVTVRFRSGGKPLSVNGEE